MTQRYQYLRTDILDGELYKVYVVHSDILEWVESILHGLDQPKKLERYLGGVYVWLTGPEETMMLLKWKDIE